MVLGGNGLVGRAVCRAAVALDYRVVSMSRSGAPSPKYADKGVEWASGDASTASAYASIGLKPDMVIHCIGTLVESARDQHRVLAYDTLRACIESNPGVKVGYVSADSFGALGPWLFPGNFKWKHLAEAMIGEAVERGEIEAAVVVKPGIVYGWERPLTVPIAWIYNIITFFTAGLLPPAKSADSLARTLVRALADASAGKRVIDARQIQ